MPKVEGLALAAAAIQDLVIAVPIYWCGMIASVRVEALDSFYHSVIGGVTNIFFFPPIVALILSVGFLREGLQRENFPEALCSDQEDFDPSLRYGPLGMLRELDPTDPASGPRWMGSTLNPTNAGYVNRHPS